MIIFFLMQWNRWFVDLWVETSSQYKRNVHHTWIPFISCAVFLILLMKLLGCTNIVKLPCSCMWLNYWLWIIIYIFLVNPHSSIAHDFFYVCFCFVFANRVLFLMLFFLFNNNEVESESDSMKAKKKHHWYQYRRTEIDKIR